jgi:2-oxoglutarate-dependent dioxygenase
LQEQLMSTTTMDVVTPLNLTPGEIRFYKEEGYLYIPRLLNDEALNALRQEVLEVMEAAGMSYGRLCQAQSSKDKLMQSGQYLDGSTLDAYINSPHLLAVATQLMEGPSTLYMPFTAVKSGGGGGTFHFHQDNQYTRFDGPGINLWCALTDMSPENGCLQVVPRSHLSGTIDSIENPDGDGHRTVAQEPERFLPVRMRAGDCIAFSRLTLHGSGPNHTAEPRIAYAVQFHRDDVSATWDGETRLLKERPRWQHQPVKELTRPQERSRDGH